MPSCQLICLSLLPACATQQTVCFHPSYLPRLRPVIPFRAGQVFSSDTVTRASRPYPRGPRSGRGYIVPVHQHLLTSSDPLACTLRFPGIRWLYGEPLLCGSAWAAREWFRAFTANPCQHAALYDHGEPTGCLYPVPSPAAQAFIFGRQIRHSHPSHHSPLPVGPPFRG
jgi:hypothetical protein